MVAHYIKATESLSVDVKLFPNLDEWLQAEAVDAPNDIGNNTVCKTPTSLSTDGSTTGPSLALSNLGFRISRSTTSPTTAGQRLDTAEMG